MKCHFHGNRGQIFVSIWDNLGLCTENGVIFKGVVARGQSSAEEDAVTLPNRADSMNFEQKFQIDQQFGSETTEVMEEKGK